MSEQRTGRDARPAPRARNLRAPLAFVFALFAIEFMDELAFGSREAAWPPLRRDLALTYTEIGLLLSLPRLFGNLVEPPLGILADVWSRRALITGGGLLFALALLLASASTGFLVLLIALLVFNPAAGAFVGTAQAALMDAEPERREQNMARWAFAGSAGQLTGSLALGATVALGAGWRALFVALAAAALLTALVAHRFTRAADGTVEQAVAKDGGSEGDGESANDDDERAADGGSVGDGESATFRASAAQALRALRQRNVWRWLLLLEIADLMLDGFHGFLALYFVDVVGTSEATAALAVSVWTGVGLLGDFLLIPLLARVRGLTYLRWSAAVALLLVPAFLVAPGLAPKLFVLGLVGAGNSGWYAILKAQLYAALPGRSGTALALHSLASALGGLLPLALGLLAERFGLGPVMWLLLVSPLTLVALLPRAGKNRGDVLG